MPQISWKLGRVAGIDLFLHPTFLILPVVLLSGGGGLERWSLIAPGLRLRRCSTSWATP